MDKQSTETELAERLERFNRLTDELERVQGERRRVQEIAGRIRQEVEAGRPVRPHERGKAADGGTGRRKK